MWIDNIASSLPKIVILRFTRVVFGITSSPFLLNATLQLHLKKYEMEDPSFVNKFMHSIYVDDVAFGGDSTNEVFELYLKTKSRLAEGGFNLMKFVSNDRGLQEKIERQEGLREMFTQGCTVAQDDNSFAKTSLSYQSDVNLGEQRVLGICWNPVEDKLQFEVKEIAQLAKQVNPTKRTIDDHYTENVHIPIPVECLSEMKAADKAVHSLLTKSIGCTPMLNCEGFSNLQKLLRVTAYVLKFIELLKSHSDCVQKPSLKLNVDDISKAEAYWIKFAQVALEEDRRFSPWKQQFNLVLDENRIWRCKGRLANANITDSAKYPILLDSSHHLTCLIVRRCHERVFHNGTKETLTELRGRFWIVKGRQVVRRILRRCVLCKRFEGKPYDEPPPPPLPVFRVQEAPPFAVTGVDYAGPLYLKDSNKVWICLFTCCVIRAVHLEVVPDMTAEAFIRCFKRFIARRGIPHKIISDNGKTFKLANKIMSAVLSHPQTEQYLSNICVDWVFNLERAPWWGGIFERMVHSIKRCLKKIVGQTRLMYDELVTVVTEIEMILNSRPLSFVSSEDLDEPLTPSHLLTGRRLLCLPDPHQMLTQTMEGPQWKREYLLELREQHRTSRKNVVGDGKVVAVGDIVVIYDQGLPRGFWKLGCVEELITGSDGQCRGAFVRVKSGRSSRSLLKHPVQHLYPLEVQCVASSHEREGSSPPALDEQPVHIDTMTSSQPKRVASQIAQLKIKDCIKELNS
eukprot:Em0006g112a